MEGLIQRLRQALPEYIIDGTVEDDELYLQIQTPLSLGRLQRLATVVRGLLEAEGLRAEDARIDGELVLLVVRVRRRPIPAYHA